MKTPKGCKLFPLNALKVICDKERLGDPIFIETANDMTQYEAPSSIVHWWILKFIKLTMNWIATSWGRHGFELSKSNAIELTSIGSMPQIEFNKALICEGFHPNYNNIVT